MRNPSLIVFPVSDIVKAKRSFTSLLGADPYVDQPYYVGFKNGEVEIGLDPNAQPGSSPVMYWTVADVEAGVKELVAAGFSLAGEIRDVGGGKLVATLRDPDGTPVGLQQPTKATS